MASEAQKAAEKKYCQSKKGKAANVRGNVKYRQTKKGKATDTRYIQSEKGKIASSPRRRRYRQSRKGKMANARSKSKRKRDLGYRPINDWFPGCHGHHIDKVNVLFIPEELHKSIRHRQSDLASMQRINKAAFEWFYNSQCQ